MEVISNSRKQVIKQGELLQSQQEGICPLELAPETTA